jgi:hypothetical protein
VARKIWEIDLASRKISCHDAAEEYQYLGGRGLTSSLVAKEVDPNRRAGFTGCFVSASPKSIVSAVREDYILPTRIAVFKWVKLIH